MIKTYYENAKKGIERRQNLSLLRNEVKDFAQMDRLYELVCDETEVLISFLSDEDAKTRKNAALLMGDLDMSDFCKPLLDAYLSEKTLFVKTAYLSAIKNYDYEEYLPVFSREKEKLQQMEITPDNIKHIEEELKLLNQLILAKEGLKKHHFKGFVMPQDLILVTNKIHKNVVEEEVKTLPIEASFTEFSGGVRLKTKDLKTLYLCRSFHSVLLVVKGISDVSFEPIEVAEAISKSGLLSMLKDSHKEGGPFYFRTEIKSNRKLDQKTIFAKKFSNELQMLTKHELINNPSNYEVELRLIETKTGKCNVLCKLNTIEDPRFWYQTSHAATSLKPANAALLVSLAKEYMVENAQVLDPFVAGGELLIERQMQVKANTSYGLDTREDAIACAKTNASNAGQIIHFINKDFAHFTHQYRFDEIFTQMPFRLGFKTQEMVDSDYRRFFEHVEDVMKENGTLILFSHDLPLLKKYSIMAEWNVIREIPIGYKEKTYLCILRKQS